MGLKASRASLRIVFTKGIPLLQLDLMFKPADVPSKQMHFNGIATVWAEFKPLDSPVVTLMLLLVQMCFQSCLIADPGLMLVSHSMWRPVSKKPCLITELCSTCSCVIRRHPKEQESSLPRQENASHKWI